MKKTAGIMVCIVILLFSCNKEKKTQDNDSINSRNIYEAVHNGDIDYIQKYIEEFQAEPLTDEHIRAASNDDLRLLRNTLYAMHGYIFKSKDLQEHFQKFAWYKGTKENVDNELNETELKLIRIISAMEAANPPSRDDFMGRWGFGFFRVYLLPDGTMAGDNGIKGSWSLEGTTFWIRPDEDVESDQYHEFPYFGENENLRIIFQERDGEFLKLCLFFNTSAETWYYAYKEPPLDGEYDTGILGRWIDTERQEWVFSADGKFTYENPDGDYREYDYTIADTKLSFCLTGNYSGIETLQEYDILILDEGQTLVLTGGTNVPDWELAGPGWSENRLTKETIKRIIK